MDKKKDQEKEPKSLKQQKLDYMKEMEAKEKEKQDSDHPEQEEEPKSKEPKKDWRKDTVWENQENQQKEAEGSGELDEDTAEEEGKDIYGGNYSAGQEADREPVSHDNVVGIRDKEDRLTPKQEAFVRQVLAGDDLSTAYRKAYDASKMSPASINREAHRLSNNPKITPRLKRGMEVREVSAEASHHSLRHSVIERLDHMANDGDASDSARVRSLELLGKHVGLFTDQVNITSERSTEELQEELTTKIAELLELEGGSGTN